MASIARVIARATADGSLLYCRFTPQYSNSRVIAKTPTTNTPTPSFPLFQSLPPELRRAIWRWLLILDQERRVLNELRVARGDDLGRIVLQLFLPNASIVSPLLTVNRESRSETLRRYPHAIRVYRGNVLGGKRNQKPAGRMRMNWYHDAFIYGGYQGPQQPWTLTLHHWVPHVKVEGRRDKKFHYCSPGHWETRRKRTWDQKRMDDILLGIRNLFV
ncbi:hypothetical protein PG984_015531 [Apiospora sp. TS-2023a]